MFWWLFIEMLPLVYWISRIIRIDALKIVKVCVWLIFIIIILCYIHSVKSLFWWKCFVRIIHHSFRFSYRIFLCIRRSSLLNLTWLTCLQHAVYMVQQSAPKLFIALMQQRPSDQRLSTVHSMDYVIVCKWSK